MKELDALRSVDFDWVRHLDSVWEDCEYDVPNLHEEIRKEFENRTIQYAASADRRSPLGWVIEGAAGTGKTHLVGAFRKIATSLGANFVMVDMTDIRDFWETVLQGFWCSLQQPFEDGKLQSELVLECLLRAAGVRKGSVKKIADLAPRKRERVATQVLSAVVQAHPQEGPAYQDVIRALILLNSNDLSQKNVGFCWLQGLAIEDPDKAAFKFNRAQAKPMEIIKGLSWVMSLRGLTILVFDQLDAIVNQHHLLAGDDVAAPAAAIPGPATMTTAKSDEQQVSKSIIEGLAGGLLAIREAASKSLSVVTCLRDTWEILRTEVLSPATDRYETPRQLSPIGDAAVARRMIANRLAPVYGLMRVRPPYPTWPFKEAFFESAASLSPRELLKRCDDHRRVCLNAGQVIEIDRLTGAVELPPSSMPEPLERFDLLAKLKQQVDPQVLFGEDNEDELLESILRTACAGLIKEHDFPADVDAVVDVDFPGGKVRPLHARIRLIFRAENEREEHCCLRAVERTNAVAFQNRLKAAMTASGIDRSLPFRRLIIVRRGPFPSGKKCGELIEFFRRAGGVFVTPTDDEIRTLGALHALKKERPIEFTEWLRADRPLSRLPMLAAAVAMLRSAAGKETGIQADAAEPPAVGVPETIESEALWPTADLWAPDKPPDSIEAPTPGSPIIPRIQNLNGKPSAADKGDPGPNAAPGNGNRLLIGYRLIGDDRCEPITMAPAGLVKHTIVLGGAGSGKTVLIKRLVEEASIRGIPSIVVDCSNDLAGLGDRRTLRPVNWTATEEAQAERYWDRTEVMIWTPGYEGGNPLVLDPLPDLAALADDPDELGQAIDMVRDGLEEIVSGGKANTSLQKMGVMTAALRHFALRGGGGLRDLIAFLADLPEEAGAEINAAPRLAAQMADGLRARMEIDPLLNKDGTRLDPGMLFGLKPSGPKTRVSVISLTGLASLSTQCLFLHQLAMTLFTWIKKNPASVDRPLTGLLVIDEAKEFVPSRQTTASSVSLIRLAAQARKYGLGLVFASQEPKSIDHKITANCSTQFFGKFNSPASIDAAQDLLRKKGGEGLDIARLPTGRFYVAAEEFPTPLKILVPHCVSDHRTLTEAEVLARAVRSRLG